MPSTTDVVTAFTCCIVAVSTPLQRSLSIRSFYSRATAQLTSLPSTAESSACSSPLPQRGTDTACPSFTLRLMSTAASLRTGDELNATALSAINNRVLAAGHSFAPVTLKDGSTVQTGTVGALLYNIGEYNAATDEARRRQLAADMEAAVPVLLKIGLVGSLFSDDEWCAEGGSEGRRLVGAMAKKRMEQQLQTQHQQQ